MQRGTARTLRRHECISEKVLHGLERSDRGAVLLALERVVARRFYGASHRAHQISGRERETERRPAPEVFLGELAAIDRCRCRHVDGDRWTGEIDARRRRRERNLGEAMVVHDHERSSRTCRVDGRRRISQ